MNFFLQACKSPFVLSLQQPTYRPGKFRLNVFFGIGLLNAACQADAQGYALRLADNADGRVCFELAKRAAS